MKIFRLYFFLTIMLALISSAEMEGRKTGYKFKIGNESKIKRGSLNSGNVIVSEEEADSIKQESGSFMVVSGSKTCNNGYSLDQVVFTGFDKTQSNSKESFFIINNTDRELTAVSLYIDYRTPDGRQLTRRFIRLSCAIPPGETRNVSIPSWDTQRSFYYHKSRKTGKGGNPFDVVFDPIAIYLRF